MADKGLIELKKENGKKVYQFLPLVPGIIEYQFMKGTVDEHSKKIAHLYRAYIKGNGQCVQVGRTAKIGKIGPCQENTGR